MRGVWLPQKDQVLRIVRTLQDDPTVSRKKKKRDAARPKKISHVARTGEGAVPNKYPAQRFVSGTLCLRNNLGRRNGKAVVFLRLS